MNTSEYSVTYYSGEKRGTTVAVLTVNETGQKFRGIAHCNPSDFFDQEIGEKIAEARARKQFFKAQANAARAQYEMAKKIVDLAKKHAEKKAARHAREEKWLAGYLATV